MLFLLKRSWRGALIGLAVLAMAGWSLRLLVPSPVPMGLSAENAALGAMAVLIVLLSDGLIHGALLLFGESYRRKHRELADLFREQGLAVMVLAALMAGIGEELCFRGLDGGPAYLFGAAVLFGLLHHINRSLVIFTFWSVWEGIL